MRPVLSNTHRPTTSKRHSTSDVIKILYTTHYIIPLFTNVVERLYEKAASGACSLL
jgi:hypothetical protein